jgi:hypothetical protein
MSQFSQAKQDAAQYVKIDNKIIAAIKRHEANIVAMDAEKTAITNTYTRIDGGMAIFAAALDHVRETTAYKAVQA